MSDRNYLSTYAKSFNWAGFFLPKETYKKCSALYDFCRVIDNIADDCDLLENKEKKFEQFQNDFKTKNFNEPIIEEMWKLINEFNISLYIIYDLFDGIKSDNDDGLYFVGAGSHPGAGVPGVLSSAKVLDKIL